MSLLLKNSKEILITWILPLATFFLAILAQVLWSPSHGDGAVYANMIREVSENGLKFPLHWGDGTPFFDHPYLFFIVSAPIFKLFVSIGFSPDVAVKIPNFIFGFLFLFLIYKIVKKTSHHGVGILACYLVIIFPVFEEQVRQPTLDVLTHLLVFGGVTAIVFQPEKISSYLIAGLLVGTSFLVKGVEILPHVAAIGILVLFHSHEKIPLKKLLVFGVYLMLPILIWFGADYLLADGVWISNYIRRQFTERFFTSSNLQSTFSFAFAKGFFSFYVLQIIILVLTVLRFWKKGFRPSLLFRYCGLYLVFLNLAFSIIKKDSSQHYFGATIAFVFMLMEVLSFWISRSSGFQFRKAANFLVYVVFAGVLAMAGYFFVNDYDQKGMWLNIKNVGRVLNEEYPIAKRVFVEGAIADEYGVVNTAYWYWPNRKIIFGKAGTDDSSDEALIVKNIESDSDLEISQFSE